MCQGAFLNFCKTFANYIDTDFFAPMNIISYCDVVNNLRSLFVKSI